MREDDKAHVNSDHEPDTVQPAIPRTWPHRKNQVNTITGRADKGALHLQIFMATEKVRKMGLQNTFEEIKEPLSQHKRSSWENENRDGPPYVW